MSTHRLFVGNLNYRVTENQLQRFFGDIGNVVSVRIVTDPTTGRSRGFGFIELRTEAEARMAIDVFDGRRLAGRVLQVRPANDRPTRPRRSEQTRPLPSWHEADDELDEERRERRASDHKPRRDWREMRRAKRSL